MPSVSFDHKGIPLNKVASIRFLNGTNDNMNANGSVTPVVFTATVPEGKRLIINRCVFYLEGSTGFDSVKFGNLTKLTNGVLFQINGGGFTFYDNIDIVMRCQNVFSIPAFSKTDRQMNGALDFTEITGGEGVYLAGNPTITIRDDLSLLTQFKCEIQGELVDVD